MFKVIRQFNYARSGAIMRFVWIFFLSLCFSIPNGVRAQEESSIGRAPRVHFEFHNSLLMNLHGFLLKASQDDKLLEKIVWTVPPTIQQRAALDQAINFYRQHFGKKNVLFNTEMLSVKQALSQAADTQNDVKNLASSDAHRSALAEVIPVYEHCLWPMHQAQNSAWILAAKTLDDKYGAHIKAEIEGWVGPAFPDRLRVDIVAYSGFWAGAYTTDNPPHSVIESGRVDYSGFAALEMLYHEASHVGLTAPLMAAIEAKLPTIDRSFDLWHAIQFYTIGEATRQVLSQQSQIEYTSYAEKRGLFAKGGPWERYAPLLHNDWRAHLHGEFERDEALTRILKKLGY